ncbi:MAG: hypothetical protein ACD_64C00181G0001 [uncultured bacterium]|nr:MAG: hypothetical protein ACD_64C00181G0001 [uncultured bacterium]
MKKHILSIVVWSLAISSFAPLCAQNEAPTWRQRAAQAWAAIPRPSLPSWAKGPGFEAAKKWWNAGRDKSVLTKQEKRAFNRFKKKFKIGTIISAIIIGVSRRLYKQREVNYIIDRFVKLTMKRKPDTDENELRAIINRGIEGNLLIVNDIEVDSDAYLIAFGATAARNTPLADKLLNKYPEDSALGIACASALKNDESRIADILNYPKVNKQNIAQAVADIAILTGNNTLVQKMLNVEGIYKQGIVEWVAATAAQENNGALVREMLNVEGIDKQGIVEWVAQTAAQQNNDELVREMLNVEGINKQKIAANVAGAAAKQNNSELVKEMLNVEGIDKKLIQQSLDKDNLWKNEYDI